MAKSSRTEVIQQRHSFLRMIVIFVGVLVAAHLLPKNPLPSNTFRLLLTVAYFASVISLCWWMTDPRSRYLHQLYAWRFEDAPANLDRAWRRYLYSLDHLVSILAWTAIAFVGSTAWSTLSLWFHGLVALSGIASLCWWISLFVLMAFPFAAQPLISEVLQRRRQLHEETTMLQGYAPRPLTALYDDADDRKLSTPVEALGNSRFRVGGVDWHWEEFTKNCVVFGQTGTGKTVCVLNALVDALMSAGSGQDTRPSGLILDPKGDFRGKIQSLCRRYGRERDLLIIDPTHPNRSIRWNPLDTADDELELSARFAAVLESLGMKDGENTFWIDSAKKFIRHAIALIRLTNEPHVPPSFRQIYDLCTSFRAVAERTDRLNVANDACDTCLSFFANEWAELADETRSSIQAYVTNMVDPFLMEPYASMFSGRSTMRIPDMITQGRILYVDMPIADKESMSRTIGTFVKLEYFREVLKSPDKARPSFFLCDEFQVFFTTTQGKGDADFFERSRQSNHVNVISTQNLPALMKQTSRPEPVKNLLGNCAIKIFLRNTDEDTNKFASGLFGQRLAAVGAASGGAGTVGVWRMKMQGVGQSASATDQYDQIVRPERFAELGIPSRASGADYCEAIVHHAGRAEMEGQGRRSRWKVHPIV